jgi:hypothetical protein
MADKPSNEEQAASFQTATFKDGEVSDGTPTAEETAAAEANAAKLADGTNVIAGDDENDDGEVIAAEGNGGTEVVEKPAENSEKNGEAAPKKAPKAGANERISDLTAKFRGAERQADLEKSRADSLQAQLDALKSGKAPLTAETTPAKAGEGSPDPSKFEYGELDPKYIAALARYETGQALAAHAATEDQSRQAVAADAKRQEATEKADKLTRAGIDLHDDFDEVVMQGAREGRWDLSQTMGELLLDSEFGPQIAYDLAKNPAESRRVAQLTPSQQAAYFGKQEAKFEAAQPSQASKTPKTPQAPPPPKTPRGGSGSNTVGADSSDFAAVEKAWRGGALH